MSADPRQVQRQPEPQRPPQRDVKREERATLPRETEKEKIKRQLYNLIDRVDKL